MSLSPPRGWYPDPTGAPGWRAWTGAEWSSATRPYGPPVVAAPLAPRLSLVRALRHVVDLGVLGVLGGLALAVGVAGHLPGSSEPLPRWFAGFAAALALGLIGVGSATYAVALRELRGRWTLDAFIPGVNFLVVGVLAGRRLGRAAGMRVATEAVLLFVFATSSRVDPWLDVAPVIVALGQGLWLSALIDRLVGPGVTPATPS